MLKSFSFQGIYAPFSVETEENGTKWGLLNQFGEVVVEPFATDILSPESSLPIGAYQLEKNGLYGLFSLDGERLTEPFAPLLQISQRFSDKTFFITEDEEAKHGLASINGEILIEPFADELSILNNQYATYKLNPEQKEGLIDLTTGKKLTDAFMTTVDYDSSANVFIYRTSDDYFNGPLGLLSSTGNIIKQPFTTFIGWRESAYYPTKDSNQEGIFDEAKLTCFLDDDTRLFGLMNSEGTIIKEPFATTITRFNENVSVFSQNLEKYKYKDAFGLIKPDGTIVKEVFAQSIGSFQNGVAWYQDFETSLFGIIRSDGKIIKEPFAAEVSDFTENGLATFNLQVKEKEGIIDSSGEVLAEPFGYRVTPINHFCYSYQTDLQKNADLGVASVTGTTLLETSEYEWLTSSHAKDRLIFKEAPASTYSFLYADGHKTDTPYRSIRSIKDSEDGLLYFAYALDGKYGLMNPDFSHHAEPFTSSIEYFQLFNGKYAKPVSENLLLYSDEGTNSLGLATLDGKPITKPFAKIIEPFNAETKLANFLYIENGLEKTGYVDTKGNIHYR